MEQIVPSWHYSTSMDEKLITGMTGWYSCSLGSGNHNIKSPLIFLAILLKAAITIISESDIPPSCVGGWGDFPCNYTMSSLLYNGKFKDFFFKYWKFELFYDAAVRTKSYYSPIRFNKNWGDFQGPRKKCSNWLNCKWSTTRLLQQILVEDYYIWSCTALNICITRDHYVTSTEKYRRNFQTFCVNEKLNPKIYQVNRRIKEEIMWLLKINQFILLYILLLGGGWKGEVEGGRENCRLK